MTTISSDTMTTIQLFGMQIDAVRMPQAIERLLTWVREPDGQCQYVVTPNVDHAVMFQEQAALRQAYADAALVLADGFPVFVAARMLGGRFRSACRGAIWCRRCLPP